MQLAMFHASFNEDNLRKQILLTQAAGQWLQIMWFLAGKILLVPTDKRSVAFELLWISSIRMSAYKRPHGTFFSCWDITLESSSHLLCGGKWLQMASPLAQYEGRRPLKGFNKGLLGEPISNPAWPSWSDAHWIIMMMTTKIPFSIQPYSYSSRLTTSVNVHPASFHP